MISSPMSPVCSSRFPRFRERKIPRPVGIVRVAGEHDAQLLDALQKGSHEERPARAVFRATMKRIPTSRAKRRSSASGARGLPPDVETNGVQPAGRLTRGYSDPLSSVARYTFGRT